jgi:predicted membrane chloride channel (bestrophin family)
MSDECKATLVQPVVFAIMLGVVIFSGPLHKIAGGCIATIKGNTLPQNAESSDSRVDSCPFFYEVRNFEKWCMNLPGPTPPAFFYRYTSSSYKQMFSTIGSGVVGRTWKSAALSAIWAGLLEWGLFFIDCKQQSIGEALLRFLNGVQSVQNSLMVLVSFLLAIYVEGRMAKHADITKSCWALRGQLINLTVVVGATVDNSCRENLVTKYKLYRYLTMLHFMVYKGIVPDQMKQFTFDHWVAKGLLEPHEAQALKDTKLPLETIVGWAADLVTAQSKTDVTVDGYINTTMVKKVVQCRAAASSLVDTCSWLPPISQAQLLAVIVEFFIMITPMSFVIYAAEPILCYNKWKESGAISGSCSTYIRVPGEMPRYSQPTLVWTMIGSACLSLFFVGLLNMVRIVEDPFGDDLDDLNPDALLMKTEQQFQSFLLAMCPSLMEEQAWAPGQTGLSKAERDERRKHKMAQHSVRPRSGRQTYQIAVHTKQAMMAGTDAHVAVTIVGDERSSGKLLLEKSETNHNAFESGNRDIFTFTDLVWLGEISHIVIGHDGADWGGGSWALDKVLIAEATTARTWLFDNRGDVIKKGRNDSGQREIKGEVSDPGGVPVDLPLARNKFNAAVNQDNLALTIERHQKQMQSVVEYAAKLEGTVNAFTQHMSSFAEQQDALDDKVQIVAKWLGELQTLQDQYAAQQRAQIEDQAYNNAHYQQQQQQQQQQYHQNEQHYVDARSPYVDQLGMHEFDLDVSQ